MDYFTANLGGNILHTVLGGIAVPAILSLLGVILSWATGKYLIPWLKTQSVIDKVKYGRHIIYLADSITDDWVELKPDSDIAKWFDEKVDELRDAVDDLREESGRRSQLKRSTAAAIIKSAISRKKTSSLNTELLDKHDFREIAKKNGS